MCSPRPGSLSDGAAAIIEARFSDLRQTLPRSQPREYLYIRSGPLQVMEFQGVIYPYVRYP